MTHDLHASLRHCMQVDATDYSRSVTARSFVSFYAQRISNNIVMHGAQGILNGLTKARNKHLRAATGAA